MSAVDVPGASANQARAGFGIRLLAILIDALVFLAIYAAAAYATKRVHPRDPTWISVFVGNAVVLAYGLTEVLWRATPGKRMLRLRIASEDGSAAPRGSLLLRYFLKYSPRILGLVDGLLMERHLRDGLAWVGWPFFRYHPYELVTARILGELLLIALIVGFLFALTPRRQGLHDRVCGTAVWSYSLAPGRHGFEAIPMAKVAMEAGEIGQATT